MSGSIESNDTSPRRTISWSSTITILITQRGLPDGQTRGNAESTSGAVSGAIFELAVVNGDAFLHPEQSTAAAVGRRFAAPGVADLDREIAVAVADANGRGGRPCVLDRVCQRLLNDAKCGEVHTRRQWSRPARRV